MCCYIFGIWITIQVYSSTDRKVNQVNPSRISLESWSNGGRDTLTSFILCCSLLQRKVPNRQLYRCSRTVTKKYSLNSNAEGNFIKKTKTTASLLLLGCCCFFKKPVHVAPVSYLSSQLPNAVDKLDKNRRAVSICVILITVSNTLREISNKRTISTELEGLRVIESVQNGYFAYQLEAVTETQPFFVQQHLKSTNGAVITVQH